MALVAIGSETIFVDDTVGGVKFTESKITEKVIRAVCVVEAAQIRIQVSGETITAEGSEGSPVRNKGDSFVVIGHPDLLAFRAIRTGDISGKVQVIYEGEGG
ncbi:hypothetical protein LCGC14_1121360 [marine sediment metagenome]|uniref:Uncharacterized protein n=1 Tax=marine sediment metagenome TaxID=412755 RepID=A0A0F9M3W7_9ZZZZ